MIHSNEGQLDRLTEECSKRIRPWRSKFTHNTSPPLLLYLLHWQSVIFQHTGKPNSWILQISRERLIGKFVKFVSLHADMENEERTDEISCIDYTKT